MNAQTLTALRASISHHKRNLKAKTPNEVALGTKSCALCGKFWKQYGNWVKCDRCPVKIRTGLNGCEGSPFDALSDAHYGWRHCDADENTNNRRLFRAAERAEIKFLESLLPVGEKP